MSIKEQKDRRESPEMVCPKCGHYPLILTGKRTGLTWKIKNGKAYCEKCMYEEEIL